MAAERLARRQLANAKIWRGDARLVMGRLVPEASLRAVHVYFPDPWWKKRHKKRRVFTDELVAQIGRALEPGGELRVASDVEEYFTLIQSLIAADPRFREQPVPEPQGPRARARLPDELRTQVSPRGAADLSGSIIRGEVEQCRLDGSDQARKPARRSGEHDDVAHVLFSIW